MFTGIIAGVARVASLERRSGGARLVLVPPSGETEFARGESVSVAGVCLTALRSGRRFSADLSTETLSRTKLGGLESGDAVNLERALRWGDRLSGHFVMGHVDGLVRLDAIEPSGRSWTYRFSVGPRLARFVVEKGSVALDGVSLTVARRRPGHFDVSVIPETRRRTTFATCRAGQRLHFEADVFARYGRSSVLARVRRAAQKR